MPDYKALYFKLFRAHNKAIRILTQAGQEAEEMVLKGKDPLDLLEALQAEKEAPEAEGGGAKE